MNLKEKITTLITFLPFCFMSIYERFFQKPKLIEFSNGKYGIRKISWGWKYYRDLDDGNWRCKGKAHFRDCQSDNLEYTKKKYNMWYPSNLDKDLTEKIIMP